MFGVLNSQAHLLNDKGKSSAGALHESGVEEHLIDRYEDGRLHSCRDGQENDQIGRGARSDELKQTFPGVNLSLTVTIKTLELSPEVKGTAMSMAEPFSQAEGITMIVIDTFSRAICTLMKIVSPFSPENSACPIWQRTPPWPPYGSDGILATEVIEKIDEVECTASVVSQRRRD